MAAGNIKLTYAREQKYRYEGGKTGFYQESERPMAAGNIYQLCALVEKNG